VIVEKFARRNFPPGDDDGRSGMCGVVAAEMETRRNWKGREWRGETRRMSVHVYRRLAAVRGHFGAFLHPQDWYHLVDGAVETMYDTR